MTSDYGAHTFRFTLILRSLLWRVCVRVLGGEGCFSPVVYILLALPGLGETWFPLKLPDQAAIVRRTPWAVHTVGR